MKRLARALTLVAALAAPGAVVVAAGLELPPSSRVVLENGVTLLLMEQREVPVVSLDFRIGPGSVADPAGKEGLASLAAEMLRKGAGSRSAEEIATDLDFIGALYRVGASHDFTRGSAEFLAKDLDAGLALLAEILLRPSFPEDEFGKLKKQEIDGLRSARDQPQAVIGRYYDAFLFGDHPYGRPSSGTEASLAAIRRADVVTFHRTHHLPKNMVMAVVGDFSAGDMQRKIARHFGAAKGKDPLPVALPTAPRATGRRLLLVDKPDSTQTFFRIGNVGVEYTHPDRVAIDVVNTLFGGRFTSMLNTELRIESGLTYGAFSYFARRRTSGPFGLSSYTANATTREAMDLALAVLSRLHEKGVTEDDLASARAYIKGQYPLDIETTDELATLLVDLEIHGLDASEIGSLYERIDAVTPEVARRVIREHFPLKNLVFTLIGKADEVAGVAATYAPKVERRSITDPGF